MTTKKNNNPKTKRCLPITQTDVPSMENQILLGECFHTLSLHWRHFSTVIDQLTFKPAAWPTGWGAMLDCAASPVTTAIPKTS